MLAATRSGVMPVSWLRAKASRTRFSFCDDLIGESRIGARIERERRQVVLVVVDDLGDAITHVAGDGLAFAEHLARHGVERVIVHADEGTAQQIDAVEHQTAGDARLTAAEIALGFADANRAGVAAEHEWMAHARRDLLQHGQIEIDDVPARQHVGIEAPTRSQNASNAAHSSATARRALRHRAGRCRRR